MSLVLSGDTGVSGNSGALIAGTAVASTSGTSIDFTSIPSWVKRITVMFNGVSTNGTSQVQVQLGAGSVTTSGYLSGSQLLAGTATNAAATSTTGMVSVGGTSNAQSGTFTLTLLNSNKWICTSILVLDNSTNYNIWGAGSVSLSGTLDRVRITTVNGTDTFDAGSINILYE